MQGPDGFDIGIKSMKGARSVTRQTRVCQNAVMRGLAFGLKGNMVRGHAFICYGFKGCIERPAYGCLHDNGNELMELRTISQPHHGLDSLGSRSPG